MIDYEHIISYDPGGSLETAFLSMRAMVKYVYEKRRMSYVDIADEVGYDVANALSKTIRRAVEAGAIESWVHSALEYKDGLDINDPQVQAQLEALVGPLFNTEMKGRLVNAGKQQVLVFPHLTAGQLQLARTMRERGEI